MTQKISWKTTLCGIISALGEALQHSGHPKLEIIGHFLMPVGLVCTGYFAKDKGVRND